MRFLNFFRVKPCHLELCHREVTRRSEPPEFSKSNRVLRRLRVGVIVHVFNVSCLFLFFSSIWPYIDPISLYLLQLNLTRFLFTCLFAVFSTLVPYLWLRPSRSGHGRPPVECRIQEARLFFFFLFLVLFWRSPHILLPLRSYSAFFLIWLQFGFCLFTDRKNQMKPNTAATRDRSRSQILDETHEHLLVRSSSHHIRHVIRHFQSLEVKASAITPSDYENISTWRPACQLLEDLTVSCQFKGHTKLAVFHILEKNLFRKLEVIKSDPVISVLSESRSRIAHKLAHWGWATSRHGFGGQFGWHLPGWDPLHAAAPGV